MAMPKVIWVCLASYEGLSFNGAPTYEATRSPSRRLCCAPQSRCEKAKRCLVKQYKAVAVEK